MVTLKVPQTSELLKGCLALRSGLGFQSDICSALSSASMLLLDVSLHMGLFLSFPSSISICFYFSLEACSLGGGGRGWRTFSAFWLNPSLRPAPSLGLGAVSFSASLSLLQPQLVQQVLLPRPQERGFVPVMSFPSPSCSEFFYQCSGDNSVCWLFLCRLGLPWCLRW